MFHAQLSPMRRRAEGRRPLLYRLRPPGFTGYRILRAGARRAASAIRAFKPGAFCFPAGGAVLPTAAAVHAAPAADPYRGPARLQRRRLEQRRPLPGLETGRQASVHPGEKSARGNGYSDCDEGENELQH